MQMALQESMEKIGSKLLRLNHQNVDKLRAYYQQQIEDPQAQVTIAVQSESARTIGMGAGKIWLHADCLPPRSGELIDIWVDPEHRRRGLSERIIPPCYDSFEPTASIFWPSIMWKATRSPRRCGESLDSSR